MKVVEHTSSGLAGAYAAKLLRDLGADVVRIGPRSERLLYEFLDTGKSQSSAVPPEADVVIASALDAEALGAVDRTRSALLTVSPYGRGGPWTERAATEFTVAAWSGGPYARGVPEQPPVSVGVEIGEYAAGVFIAVLALAYSGRAVELDVSLLECTMAVSGHTGLTAQLAGAPMPQRRTIEIPSIEPAADGYVGVATVTAQQLADFWVLIERPDLVGHPDYLSMPQRWARRDEVQAAVRAWTRRHTVAEIVEQAALFRIPCVPLGTGESLPRTDHFVETAAYVRSANGRFVHPVPPFKFAQPPALASEPRPRTKRPLDGVRVTAFTAYWAGPWAAALCSALGADVITIESIQRPDGIRYQSARPSTADAWWEFGGTFHANNAGKRAVTLDLDSAEGRSIAEQLIAQSDLVIENYSARVMDNFGLGYERMRELNPSIVMVRMPAFGLSGPWRDRTAFAMNIEQASGLGWMTGHPDADPCVPRGACDPLAGMHAAAAALAALEHRRRTGLGQLVEVSMIGAAINVAAEQVIEYSATGELMSRRGNAGGAGVLLQGYFRCRDWDPPHPRRDPDRYLAVAVTTSEQFALLRDVVGGTTEADVAEWCRSRELDDALDALWTHGIPAARVEPGADLIDNPQLRARGFWEAHDHPLAGRLEYPSMPARYVDDGVLSREPWWRGAAPTLGQHTRDVLRELGCSDAELDDLAARAIIGTVPRHAGKPV